MAARAAALAGGLSERGVRQGHVVALLPFNQPLLDTTTLYDLADRFATGFARFPYIESFFVWKNASDRDGSTFFFDRSDRPPAWESVDESGDPYPVMIRRDPLPVT